MKNIGEFFEHMQNKIKINENFHSLMEKVWNDPDVIKFLEEHQEQLTAEAIERSASNLYEYVTEKEKFKTDDQPMVPGHYPQLILNNNFIEVTYVPTTSYLKQQKQRAAKQRVHSLYLPSDLKQARLDDYEQTSGRLEALEKVIRFLENYPKDPKKYYRGLYLYGSFGVGKTYLMGALANELSNLGIESTLVHYPTFTTKMKESIGTNTTSDRLTEFQNTPVLFLDDIGAEANSTWLRDDILGVILQYRMQERLATFFSSNQNMALLEEHFADTIKGDVEPVKAARIMERVKYLAEEVTVSGYNRRNP